MCHILQFKTPPAAHFQSENYFYRLPTALFRWFCHPDFLEEIEGDLLEQFHLDVAELGENKARRLFAANVLRLCRPEITFHFSNFVAMKNSDWLRLLALNLLFAVFVVLPFLPGPPNKLSIGLSGLGQMAGFFGAFLFPVSLVWAFFELRKLRSVKRLKVNLWNKGFWFAIASALVGVFGFAIFTAGMTHEDGWWVTAVCVPIGLFLLWKTVQGIGGLRRQTALKFNPAPLYLLTIPLVALTAKMWLQDPLAAVSREKVIRQSEPLIAAIEQFRQQEGRYPDSLADLQPAYLADLPGSRVMGVRRFDYEKSAEAYYLTFKQVHGATIEIVEYDKTQSHRRKGHYLSGEAGAENWRYYWLD